MMACERHWTSLFRAEVFAEPIGGKGGGGSEGAGLGEEVVRAGDDPHFGDAGELVHALFVPLDDGSILATGDEEDGCPDAGEQIIRKIRAATA